MLRYIFIIIPLLTACSKSENTRADEKKEPSKIYEIKTHNKTVNDELSPSGFWETNISYPIITLNKNSVIDSINNKIETLSNEYSCDDSRGDKQFTASVTYTSKLVLSINFTDTWLCVGMPHPDGRTGSITFDMQSGKEVNIEDVFIDDDKKKEFITKIAEDFNKIIAENDYEGCPKSPTWNQYYLTNQGINFLYSQSDSIELPCEIEVPVNIEDLKKYLKNDSILLIR